MLNKFTLSALIALILVTIASAAIVNHQTAAPTGSEWLQRMGTVDRQLDMTGAEWLQPPTDVHARHALGRGPAL
jgi:hypothetical protein